MTERLTICLVGPRGAGKSSMLAAATDCVVQNAHGYPSELRPAMQPITRAAFHGLDSNASKLDILDAFADDYQKLRREFAEGCAPTGAHVQEYFFRLTSYGEASADILENSPYLVRVVDAGGELAIPDEAASTDLPTILRDDFAAKLLNAESLVLVLPLVRFEDAGWIADIARLVDRLTLAPERKLRRVAVAFSKFERLFVRFGPSAFTYACDPAVTLYALRKSLRAAPWIDSLRALEARGDVDVRFTAISAFGFAKTFQNPNIDPHRKDERRFSRSGVSGPRAHAEFWRPFLAADPILYAALGIESAFMFSFAAIDGKAQKPKAP